MDVEIKQFVENGLKVVEKLLKDKQYLDAAHACKEILDVDPRNKKAKKFLEEALDYIEKEKEDIFKKNFPKLKELMKEGEYEKAIEIGEKLEQVSTEGKLESAMHKCREKLKAKQQNEAKDFIKNGFKKHKELTKQKKWIEALEVLKEMLEIDRKNESIRAYIKSDKIHYIDDQLHSDVKKSLLKGKEYEKLYKFYQKLYKIFPEHKKLIKEIKKAEKLISGKNRENKQEFIQKSIAEIKQQIQEKKYEQAIQTAKEIVSFTEGENSKAKHLLKKAEELNGKDTEQKLKKKLSELLPILKAEFKANKKAFVKI